MTDTDTDTTDATILEWHAKGVRPGGIANVLEALGFGRWSAKGVGAALKRLGIKADTLRAANAQARAEKLRGIVGPLLDQGATIRAIGAALNKANIATPKGGAWHPSTVARLVARLA